MDFVVKYTSFHGSGFLWVKSMSFSSHDGFQNPRTNKQTELKMESCRKLGQRSYKPQTCSTAGLTVFFTAARFLQDEIKRREHGNSACAIEDVLGEQPGFRRSLRLELNMSDQVQTELLDSSPHRTPQKNRQATRVRTEHTCWPEPQLSGRMCPGRLCLL